MDTVIYRLHNIKDKYPMIWQLCQRPDRGNQIVATASEKPGEVVDTVMKFYLNFKEGSAIHIRYSDKRNVPSSNHDIPFFIDQVKDYLEINVSIPKYLFGNNVLECITPPNDRAFNAGQLSPYHHVNFWYKLIKEVAYRLIHLIANNNHVALDWNDLEVARIDMAINQMFFSRDMAVKYLKYMSGIMKRHQRKDATGRQISYQDETLFFPSENYSVKIYHKGQEFFRLQSKKIMEINKQRKADAMTQGGQFVTRLLSSNIEYSDKNIQQLQEYSDKILRYEFTFRSGYMSYIFNRKINKHWSRAWASFKRIFDYIEKDVQNKNFLTKSYVRYYDVAGLKSHPSVAMSKKYFVDERIEVGFEGSGKFNVVSRELTDKEYMYLKVLRKHGIVDRTDLAMWLKFMQKELNQARTFRVKLEGERDTMREFSKVIDDRTNMPTFINDAMTQTPKFVRFSRTLLKFMVADLEKFFNNFQIDTKPTYSQLLDKIEKHNMVLDDQRINAGPVELKRIDKLYVNPRTMRALVEFNNLHGKLAPKTVRTHYQKTTYFRLLKLHQLISGQKFQVSAQDFGEVNRDFDKIYKGLHEEMSKGYLLKFYNNAFAGHYAL